MAREIEIRARIDGAAEATARLAANGFKLIGRTYQHDIMFDKADGALFTSGQKIRMRIEEQSVTLTYKGKFEGNGGISNRDEIEFHINVSDIDSASRFLQSLGYPILFQIKKERFTYSKSSVQATIDNWPIIGPILEFEGAESDILEFSTSIFPEYKFGNPRLKELFEERCSMERKSLSQLKQDYENETGFDLGNLEFLIA